MEWTPEMDEMLTDLWRRGLTGSSIANRMPQDVSRSAVIARARRLGLATRPSPILRGDPRPVLLKRPQKQKATNPRERLETDKLDRTKGCQWIMSDGYPYIRCDCPVRHGTSWCPDHYSRVYQTKPVKYVLVTAKKERMAW